MDSEEHEIQKQIQVALSKHSCSVQRINVGKGFLIRHSQVIGQSKDGNYIVRGPLNYFAAGASKGHPDLYGFRWSDHQVFYIEVKNEKGKPRADQIKFHEMLTKREIIHGIARSAGDARKIVGKGLVGYGFN